MAGSATDQRSVLVHYHLFKNAGTSVERILRNSYGERWVKFDKAEPGAKISGAEMQAYIEANPTIKAVSSHQLVPAMPQGDFTVTPLVFLREPLARVKSAYLFEWQKQLGLEEPKGPLGDYIEEKFMQKHTSVIANFQVSRLSNTDYVDTCLHITRYEEKLLLNAKEFVDQLPFFGLVDRFADSLELMRYHTASGFPELKIEEHRENVLQHTDQSQEQRIDSLRREIGNGLFDELCVRNRFDMQLYSYAQGRFAAAVEAMSAQGSSTAFDFTLRRRSA